MEDEEETQSHASGGSRSQSSPTPTPPSLPPPRPNGRITVTVAAVPSSSQPNALTLALPIQQNQQQQPQSQAKAAGNGGDGGGREDCWSEGATGVLIDAWGERYLELSRGNLTQKHWKDVADKVSSREDYSKTPKTDIQCKNRIDTVKKKYKLEKAKITSGGGPSKWPFFERLDQLIGTSAKLNSSSSAVAVGPPSASQRVPRGIPMGVRSAPQFWQQQQLEKFQLPQLNPKQLFRKRPPPPPVEDSDEEESEQEPSPDSADDFPPGKYERKRPRNQRELLNMGSGTRNGLVNNNNNNNNRRGKEGGAERAESEVGNPLRELTRAILKFGEAYEHAEALKLQQLVDMEKQRMKFAKAMELQRMQFFMKTQLELSQLKCSSSTRRVGNTPNNNNNNHHQHNNSSNHNAAAKDSSNNNSDSSN